MKKETPFGAVPRYLVGDNGPSVVPGYDKANFGYASISPIIPVEARSFHTVTLTYTVGKLGIDDTGAIRVCWRMVSDAGRPQMDNPSGENFVTATSSGEGSLVIKFEQLGGQSPWN